MTADTDRIAKITVDWKLIRAALQMPKETDLVNVALSVSFAGAIDLVLRHPSFEPVGLGRPIPKAYPSIELASGQLKWNWNTEEKGHDKQGNKVEAEGKEGGQKATPDQAGQASRDTADISESRAAFNKYPAG